MRPARHALPLAFVLVCAGPGCGRVGYQALFVSEDAASPQFGADTGVMDGSTPRDAGGGGLDGGGADGGGADGGGLDADMADVPATPDAGNDGGGGVDAGPPDPTAPITADVTTFSTAAANFVNVPGGSLQATADAATAWVTLVSARLCTSVAVPPTGVEAQLLVDGVARGFGGIAVDTASRCGGFQQAVVLEQGSGSRDVQMQLRHVGGGTATIDNLHVVAFPLTDADLFTSERLNVQNVVSTTHSDFHSLTFTPRSPGDYLVIAMASAIEDDGSNVFVRFVQSGSAAAWPSPDFSVARAAWQSTFAVERRTLPATSQTFVVQARVGSATTGRVRSARIIAFRTDALAHFESNPPGSGTSVATTNTLVAQRTSAPPTGLTGQIILQSQASNVLCGFRGAHTPSFTVDGTTETIPHSLHCGNRASYSRFTYVADDRPITAQNFVTAEVSGNQATATNSTIHVLGF